MLVGGSTCLYVKGIQLFFPTRGRLWTEEFSRWPKRERWLWEGGREARLGHEFATSREEFRQLTQRMVPPGTSNMTLSCRI